MNIALVFFLAHVIALAQVGVTSQEQFKRLKQSGSPNDLNYNFERAYLEVRANDNCPSGGKAFYRIHVSESGEVKKVRGRLVALSADLRGVALKWADGILKQLHFRPLMYGNQPASVNMALTLVCVPSSSGAGADDNRTRAIQTSP